VSERPPGRAIVKRKRPIRQKTRASVRFADAASRTLITVGGIGTIVAVALVFLFLLIVAVPLFFPARVTASSVAELDTPWEAPLQFGVDEYLTMAWGLYPDGRLTAYDLKTGRILSENRPFEGEAGLPTAISSRPGATSLAMGFEDGTIRLGEIGFRTRFLEDGEATASLRELKPGDSIAWTGGLVTRTSAGQLRLQELLVQFDDPIRVGSGAPIRLLGHAQTPGGPVLCKWSEDGELVLAQIQVRRNMLTGATTASARSAEVKYEAPEPGDPIHLKIAGLGASVILAWPGGSALEFATHSISNVTEPQLLRLLDKDDAHLATLSPMIGSVTFIVGDDTGSAEVWFPVRNEAEGGPPVLTHARTLPPGKAPVVAASPSSRSRALALAYADGEIRLVHATSNKLLASMRVDVPEDAGPSSIALALAPKDDGLVAMTAGGLYRWSLDIRHPEASFRSLFGRVWYEGYPQPQFVWQSSSGTDDFEPKLSLIPLIFGTVKATVYSALFGVPLALLAAIYTSEFLSRRWRTPIKSTVELMAALPSVVLGFLAALIIAPFVERVLPAVLTVFLVVPLALILGACFWQLLPRRLYLSLSPFRATATYLVLIAAVLLAVRLGPPLQDWLFAGNIRLWLDGERGTAWGGWILLLYPAVAVGIGLLVGMRLRPALAVRLIDVSRFKLGILDLALVSASILAAFGLLWGIATVLTAAGFDPRGGVLSTYVQRNTFVVGFVMGFAIIPIIYTIAEDAFTSVPDHLRSASLAAGATQWQTVSRIVLPTAMSGVFSAVMIGLGRAVGETMIVLMAAGNTPILEWNIFSGFRTLSANLAVELPEAVRGGTHYRTLFLAALVLFLMTFAVNSLAEVIRRRYQRKWTQL
jgi:phosphate transport system permease protein